MGRPDELPDAGIPTDETDALWEDLYQCTFPSLGSFLFFPSQLSFKPHETIAYYPRLSFLNSRYIPNPLLGRAQITQRHGMDSRQQRAIHRRARRVPSTALSERRPQDLFSGTVSRFLRGLLA